MVKKISTAAEAIANVRDGDLVIANFWGPGSPAHLWRALKDHGAKDLTICINNYVPKTEALREKGTPDPSLILSQTKKIISAFTGIRREEIQPIADEIDQRIENGSLEFESISHGILIERLFAAAMGLGGIYSPIGVGTSVEEGREKRIINGKAYLFQEPIVPDVGLISAAKADTLGNLVYHGTARASNPIIAMASKFTIAEVLEIVEPGELDPDHIVTPSVFIDRVVLIPDDDGVSMKKRREWVMESIKHRREQQEKREKEEAARRGES
jgi:3-oxoacid CoA-transferase A subunit